MHLNTEVQTIKEASHIWEQIYSKIILKNNKMILKDLAT